MERGRGPGLVAEVARDQQELIGALAVVPVAEGRFAQAHAPPFVLVGQRGEQEEVVRALDLGVREKPAGDQQRHRPHEALRQVVPVAIAIHHHRVQPAQLVARDLGIADVAGPRPHQGVGADQPDRLGDELEAARAQRLQRGRVLERGVRPAREVRGDPGIELDLEEPGHGGGRTRLGEHRDELFNGAGDAAQGAAAGQDQVRTGAEGVDEGAEVVAVATRVDGVGRAEEIRVQRQEHAVGVEAAEDHERPPPVPVGEGRAALGQQRGVRNALRRPAALGGDRRGDLLREGAVGRIGGGIDNDGGAGASLAERGGALGRARQHGDGRIAGDGRGHGVAADGAPHA